MGKRTFDTTSPYLVIDHSRTLKNKNEISMTNLFEDNGAEFSKDRKHRYALWRIWDKEKPLVMIIGLNPSKANETKPDNTVTRVRGIATNLGYGGFYMMNLFSFVSTDPWKLEVCKDHTLNDSWLNQVRKSCRDVIFAWGKFPVAKERSKEVIKMFPDAKALIINLDGSPRHPLYVKGNVIPTAYLPTT